MLPSLSRKKGIRMLVAGKLSAKHKKRTMQLKKKQQLGQKLPEITSGETEASRTESFSAHPSANRETPTTIVLTI
jgi:hypothetical protein